MIYEKYNEHGEGLGGYHVTKCSSGNICSLLLIGVISLLIYAIVQVASGKVQYSFDINN